MDNKFDIDASPPIPALPMLKDKTKVDVRYAVISPYATVHIYWDSQNSELKYEVEEPILQQNEKLALEKIEKGMMELININVVVEKTQEAVLDYLDKTARLLINELNIAITEASYNRIFYYLYRDFVGLNEIDPLINDYFIEDIECNGVNSPIYIVHRIYRNIRTNITFDSIDKLASFVEKLAQRAGRYISYASPILDGSLPDGSRVNATYTTDISSKGPTFTIRKFTTLPWTPIQLISFNTLSPEMLAYFWLLIQYKSNILIAGGTSSGKTTLLNAISFFIPPEARVVSIEDSVTGDSKIVINEKGTIRNISIKEFVDKKINAEIMTLDEKGKIIFVKPSNYIKHKVKKDIYEVTTATGRKVKVTKDHSLFSMGEKELKEIKPTELKNGSFIAVPRSLPIEGNEIKEINLMNHLNKFESYFLCGDPIKKVFDKYSYNDLKVEKERYRWWKSHNLIKISDFISLNINFSYKELKELKIKSKNTGAIPILFNINDEFLKFCGLWLGDGSYDSHNENVVIISNVDEECRDIIKRIAEYTNSNYSIMTDKGVSIRIHNIILYHFMKDVLGFDGYSNTKNIPEFIFNLSNRQIKSFIAGYFSADGCVKKYEVSCASQSYQLLESLQTLFLRFGIISRINDFNRYDKCMNMSISSHENIKKFKEIGFLQERKNIKLNEINFKSHHTSSDIIPLSIKQLKDVNKNNRLSWPYLQGMQNIGRNYLQEIAPKGSIFNDLSHSDIFWDKVKEIKKVSSDEVEVFDLSVPGYEKFICNNIFVHNTRELNLPRENWLPSVSRSAIGVGTIGEVDLFKLLKNSFRQNPDYVIVGEVRGQEAFVLFQGMASGHSSLSTIHADSVDTVIKRLETPPIELSPTLINTLDAVAIMSHAIVKKEHTRRLSSIVEVINVNPDGIAMTNTPFIWNPSEDKFYFKKDSKVFDKIKRRYGLTDEQIQTEFNFRTKLIYEMFRRKIFDFNEIQIIVNEYYKNPEIVLKRFGIGQAAAPQKMLQKQRYF